MLSCEDIAPYVVFKSIADSLKNSVSVTVSQSGDTTTLTGSFENVNIGNVVVCDCGDLSGNKMVVDVANDLSWIKIKYDGSYTDGVVKTHPYFRWGSLSKVNELINQTQEYPLICLLLPNPYSINIEEDNPTYIDDLFDLLFIDKYKQAENEEESETQRIYDQCVSDMSALQLNYLKLLDKSPYVAELTDITKSDEIPFGITIGNNQDGKDEAVFDWLNAGCYVKMRVRIKKQYKCN